MEAINTLGVGHKRVLGIDPGSRVLGFALLEGKRARTLQPRDFVIRDLGVLRADLKKPFYERLGELTGILSELLVEWNPHLCVMESAFVGRNVRSALKLGEARGAFMNALYREKIPLFEMPPALVKTTITGEGHASKEKVAECALRIMAMESASFPYDATDALAIALSHVMRSPY